MYYLISDLFCDYFHLIDEIIYLSQLLPLHAREDVTAASFLTSLIIAFKYRKMRAIRPLGIFTVLLNIGSVSTYSSYVENSIDLASVVFLLVA